MFWWLKIHFYKKHFDHYVGVFYNVLHVYVIFSSELVFLIKETHQTEEIQEIETEQYQQYGQGATALGPMGVFDVTIK